VLAVAASASVLVLVLAAVSAAALVYQLVLVVVYASQPVPAASVAATCLLRVAPLLLAKLAVSVSRLLVLCYLVVAVM
jgi:hypothetical protein